MEQEEKQERTDIDKDQEFQLLKSSISSVASFTLPEELLKHFKNDDERVLVFLAHFTANCDFAVSIMQEMGLEDSSMKEVALRLLSNAHEDVLKKTGDFCDEPINPNV